ncbi:MAG TPA: hypothetical protein VMI54_06375 [Polyangiaceae bacterium]|nr:hypothetical protein [Polyangiaceae bacterium]
MTSAVASGLETLPLAPSRTRPLVEFLLVGGLTLVLFPLAWLAERSLGVDAAELAVGFTAFHAAFVINDPHFSVTYLLFYRNARERAFGRAFAPLQRARYVFAGVVAPLALVAWTVLAIADGSARSLGSLMELMFALVGWHYVKQGFGVLLVLAGRRGVRYGAAERRVLLFHAFAGWAFAWANPSGPSREVEEKGVVYTALAHPRWLELVTGGAFAVSTLLLAAMLVVKARREGRAPPLAPLVGFLASIWLWSIFSSVDPLMLYVVPALHSLQYLYFVWLLRRNEAREAEAPPRFGRPTRERLITLAAAAVALGAVQFHLAPALFDGARLLVPHRLPLVLADLGPTPWFAGIYAVINIHHYLMDTVIWRRENPDTRYLYR